MRTPGRWFALAVLAAPALAQTSTQLPAVRRQVEAKPASATKPSSAGGGAVSKPGMMHYVLGQQEKTFDRRLSAEGMDLIGNTRALYLSGYGAIFTAEVSLAQIAGNSPFRHVDDAFKVRTHQQKLDNLPKLRKALQDMASSTAKSLDGLPDSEQIVIAMRFWYESWENTGGLPTQILLRADRKSALAGQFQTEEQ